MKIVYTILLLLSTLDLIKAMDVPAGLTTLIEHPLNISETSDPSRRGAFSVPADGAIIIADGIISYLSIRSINHQEKKFEYSFRTFSTVFKMEITGNGQLFENYYKITSPGSNSRDARVIDRGSKLMIDAGIYKAEWSADRYIYFDPDQYEVSTGSEADYEHMISEAEQGAAANP